MHKYITVIFKKLVLKSQQLGDAFKIKLLSF